MIPGSVAVEAGRIKQDRRGRSGRGNAKRHSFARRSVHALLVNMNRLHLLFLLSWTTVLQTKAADYQGRIGKLEAVFSLEWHDDGSVTGAYGHPAKPGKVYSLVGSNPAEGELYLEEFTGDALTARCYLRKEIADGVILWRGEMRNTDGRILPMEFARAREKGPAESPPGPAAEENLYSGYVGRMDAEFRLAWHEDGTLSGSYHYPQRPDATYRLLGLNPAEGELFLAEYTGDRLTAKCLLHKRLEADAIVWEGLMMNEDGRHFPMAFARARANGNAAGSVDDYEAERRALFASIGESARWDDFPLADAVIERVPVHLDDAEYFGARILSWRSDGIGTTIRMSVADWDSEGKLLIDAGREVTLRAARTLPLPPGLLEGREIAVLVAADGSIHSLELFDIAITQVRRGDSGKFEVRGVIDLFTIDESFDWSPERFAEKMREAPVIEFLPDKLALDLDPSRDPELAEGDVFFQTVRLVRDHGFAIQATGAGAGSLELESLSLDSTSDTNPWIPLKGLKEALKAPPIQYTTQAG